MSDFHLLTVSEVKKETPNAVLVTFEIPENLKSTFQFKAGQYITIKHNHNGTEIRRAYSISCAPHDQTIQVGIKKVDGGSFSVYANETLKAGDQLEVMPPQGKFIVETASENKKNYAAFAAGSGITPIMSIIRTVLQEEPNSTFLLVFGNRTTAESMFYDSLKSLEAKFPGRFFLELLFSRENSDEGYFGRIENSTVNLMVKNKYKDVNFDLYYLCGPEPMIDAVSATLKQNGVNEKKIRFELFTTSEEGLLVEPHTGDTEITIIIDEETETFHMPKKKSVLEAALDKGLDAPYSCQGGICSTCIARVVEGKVEMRKNQILTDSELAEGLILTCQAHPTTAKLIVDYDDV